ncbi:MAG: hypothetical protein JEZ11_17635 [Desulfobacterales bacterium]|nr:hypothetical protein [Desulfobacterales bacterium]
MNNDFNSKIGSGKFAWTYRLDDPDGLDDTTVTDDTDTEGFTGKDAFFIGSAMGWAYEEGREEAEHLRLIKKEWHKSKKNE